MLRIGLIGTGILGNIHAKTVAESNREVLAAVADINEEKGRACASKYGAVYYEDYNTMLKQEELDGIIVATPDFAHKDPVLSSIRAGKHVLVEKPIAIDLSDAKDIVDEIRKGQKLMVNFTNRWAPPFVKAKEILDSGKIGKPLMLSAKLNDTLWVSTEMMSWAAKTSPAAFLGSHDIDLFTWMFDSEVIEVYANGIKNVLLKRGIDTYDAIQVNVKFANGCIGVFENSWIMPNTYHMVADGRKQIYAEEGFINLEMGNDQIEVYDRTGGTHPAFYIRYEVQGMVAGAFKHAHDHFIDCVLNGTKPGPGPESAYRVTMVIEAVHRSIESGKPVSLPID